MTLQMEHFSTTAHYFFEELAEELKSPGDIKRSCRVFQSALHGIRDHLNIQNALYFKDQLPVYLKDLYLQNWDKQGLGYSDYKGSLVDGVVSKMLNDTLVSKNSDLLNKDNATTALVSIFRVMGRHMTRKRKKEIMEVLPGELSHWWSQVVEVNKDF